MTQCPCAMELRRLKALVAILTIFIFAQFTFSHYELKKVVAASVPEVITTKSIVVVDDTGKQVARIGQIIDPDRPKMKMVSLSMNTSDGFAAYAIDLRERLTQGGGTSTDGSVIVRSQLDLINRKGPAWLSMINGRVQSFERLSESGPSLNLSFGGQSSEISPHSTVGVGIAAGWQARNPPNNSLGLQTCKNSELSDCSVSFQPPKK